MVTFENVQTLARMVEARGGRAFLVGGYVRDKLMNRESKDFDLEIYNIEIHTLKTVLETFVMWYNFHGPIDSPVLKLNLVGESFQVFKVGLNLDVSIPRTDRKVSEGHKGFEITGDPYLSTLEASRRRDFTMNAMLLDPLTGEIIDHFGGKFDIEFGLVRLVDKETFVEDSLRALRAIQFASRFGFDIRSETMWTIREMDLKDLPRERVWMEFEKWLMLSPKPSVGLFLMQELGILEKLFPELDKLVGVPQDVRYHPEGDVFVHTALALDVARQASAGLPYPEQVTVMLATLCHDLGKFETTKVFAEFPDKTRFYLSPADWAKNAGYDGIRVTAHGHAEAGVSLARNILDRLALHSIDGYDVRGQVLALVENHLAPFEFHRQPPRDSAFRRLALKVDLNLLHKVARADSESRNVNSLGRVFDTEAQDWFLEKITNLAIPVQGPEKILMGRHLIDLGMKPSKAMGEIVAKVFEAQIEGTVTNLDEALETAKKLMGGASL